MSMRATSGISKAAKCTAAISTAFTLATFGADDDTFSVASGPANSLIGVFQSTTVNAGDSVEVMVSGISNIVLGGTCTRGDRITSDANGNGITATRHTHTENTAASYTQNATTGAAPVDNVIGMALERGVSGDILAVLLTSASY